MVADGAHIVFTRDAGGQTFNLWTARADGTAQLRAHERPGDTAELVPRLGQRASPRPIATLEPVADTFVRASDPDTAHGTETTFDVYAGASLYCDRGPGPAYGLLRFDLSSLPAGVNVTDARLDLTVDGGFAQDGDPSHYAIRLNSNTWAESVTWNTRPADGIVPDAAGPPLRADDQRRPALRLRGRARDRQRLQRQLRREQRRPRRFARFIAPSDRPQNFATAVGERDRHRTACPSRSGASRAGPSRPPSRARTAEPEQAYYLRYFSREAADPARPAEARRHVHVGSRRHVVRRDARRSESGLAQVDLDDVPASVLLAPARTTASAPLGETPLGETPLGETPLGETPLGETPLGETSLGLDDLIAELRTVPLSSLPLLREGGWPAVLRHPDADPLANRALQNVSLGDVFALTPRPAVLDGQGTTTSRWPTSTTRAAPSATWSRSRTRSAAASTLADLSGAFTNGVLDPDLQRWCTITNTHCAQTSVLALGLSGAPLGETPLGETPLGETLLWDTPLGETPLGETPLGETPLGETPLGETPLGETATGDTPLGETPLGETPLGETDLSRAPLGETPLGETPLGETISAAPRSGRRRSARR